MDLTVLAVFILVYLGMMLGEFPLLRLDRTGVALLGAIALLALEKITPQAAWQAVDIPTIGLLLGLMIVSAQFRLGGFYTWLTRHLSQMPLSPAGVLLVTMLAVGCLSALLANDIVCLAVAPVLIEGCRRRGLDPIPHLLGLAMAANIGSAATLIGNPQNILIGARLNLSFGDYLIDALPPATLGLFIAWVILVLLQRGRWLVPGSAPGLTPGNTVAGTATFNASSPQLQPGDIAAPHPFNLYQTIKGALIVLVLVVLFLTTVWPREVLALVAAGLLMLSRRFASRHILALVDWQLLVLFAGLFIVNHSLAASGTLGQLMTHLQHTGINVEHPGWLFVTSTLLSNLVSNVPAVMLLLPWATHPDAGPILALSSTLAGNLIIVGSIANIIVLDIAARMGVPIGWKTHAKAGIPITLATLALTALWLWLR